MADAQYLGPCFGERGRLTHVGDQVQCHICGNAFHNLGSHVWCTHDISATEYRRLFLLHRTLGLVSDKLHAKLAVVRGASLKNYHDRSRHIRDAYEVNCVVCRAPLVVRLSPKNPVPQLCQRPECRSQHTRTIHLNATESPSARATIKRAAQRRGCAWLHTPSSRAKAAATNRGRKLSEAQKEKLRQPRVERIEQPCVICAAPIVGPASDIRKTCGRACLRRRNQLNAMEKLVANRGRTNVTN